MAALGNRAEMPIHPMRDSSGVAHDAAAVRERLKDDGYLLLRNLIPRAAVDAAHRRVADKLQALGWLDPGSPPELCVPADPFPHQAAGSVGTIPGIGDWANPLTHEPPLLRVVEAPELVAVCERVFGEPSATYYRKWLRTVPCGEGTPFHMDGHLFCHPEWGSPMDATLSAWIPLADTPIALGGLAVLRGSNSLPGFEHMRNSYLQNLERVNFIPDDGGEGGVGRGGWPTASTSTLFATNQSVACWCDPVELQRYDPEAQWVSTDYRVGDVSLVYGPLLAQPALLTAAVVPGAPVPHGIHARLAHKHH